MPYSPDNPPDKVKGLPAKKQRQWVYVFNQALDDGDDEGTAHAKAWGVVKKSSCEGRTYGPTESEGSLADATLNSDILNAEDCQAAREMMVVAHEMALFNRRLAVSLLREAKVLAETERDFDAGR